VTKASHLIILSGLPGSGKTTLLNRIRDQIELPIFEKDAIKESLYETLGWSDREWSKRLGTATHSLIDYIIEQQLRAGASFLMEGNFKPEFDDEKFRAWQQTYDCTITQIICKTDKATLEQRFIARANGDTRHPGHADATALDEWRTYLAHASEIQPLNVESHIEIIDTTNTDTIDYSAIIELINS